MRKSITMKVEDIKHEEEQATAYSEYHLRFAHDYVLDVMAEMIDERSNESDVADNIKTQHQFEGYTMALEDLYYRLYGKQFDIGQDIEPVDYTEAF